MTPGDRDDRRPRRSRRLSSSIGVLKPHYDVVVVGSGYGGAVTAARLAEAGKRVCIVERGRELQPGDYPDTLTKAAREFQVDTPARRLFSPTALYDLRVNPDLSVFMGCGLGGTSLINANVAMRPDRDVFIDAAWPRAIREEAANRVLWKWFSRAEAVLRPRTDRHADKPHKLKSLEAARDAFGAGTRVGLAPVTVDFGACTHCGDCVSGCNYRAKQTLLENYLRLAHAHAAEIFTEVKVRRVTKRTGMKGPGQWIVHIDPLGMGRERFASSPLFVTADTVILSAGALGSPEILMRSSRQTDGLAVSARLGQQFSGNGDLLAFAYNNRERVNGIGFGVRSPHGHEAPGTCISSYVRRGQPPSRMLFEDGVIPGALSPILSLGFALAGVLGASGARPATNPGRSRWRRTTDALRGGADTTLTFLAMVEDSGHGDLVWQDDRVRIRWPGAGTGALYSEADGILRQAAASLDGSYIANPLGHVTVHPLGGCVMADDPANGVVSDSGAVFDPDMVDGRPFHDGLYVCDASVVPRALIANPLLTITALAERTAAHIVARAGA